MSRFKETLFSSIGKKIIMATSGGLLTLFLLGHLAGNATAFMGRESLNAYAAGLHALGFPIKIIEASLLLIFLVHMTTGFFLFIENRRARPIRYAACQKEGFEKWGCRTMPYTGLIILIFLIVHLLNFHFIDHAATTADLLRTTLSRPLYGWFYVFCLAGLILHTSHGFWSMLQTMGLNHPRYNRLCQKGTLISSLLLGGFFILLPLLALFHKNFLR